MTFQMLIYFKGYSFCQFILGISKILSWFSWCIHTTTSFISSITLSFTTFPWFYDIPLILRHFPDFTTFHWLLRHSPDFTRFHWLLRHSPSFYDISLTFTIFSSILIFPFILWHSQISRIFVKIHTFPLLLWQWHIPLTFKTSRNSLTFVQYCPYIITAGAPKRKKTNS